MSKIINTYDLHEKVTFHTFEGNTGINVSGGADSALLLYLTMIGTSDTIHIMTLGNSQRYRRNVVVAMQVVERCIQLTGNNNVVHHIHNCPVQNFEEIKKMYMTYIDNETLDVMTGAITANPPKDVTDTFILPVTENDRDPDEEYETLFEREGKYIWHLPFRNVDKSVIAEIYRDFNLMEDLFPYTRSCEFDPTVNNGTTVDPGLGHCGKCWWCEERKWAFGRLT